MVATAYYRSTNSYIEAEWESSSYRCIYLDGQNRLSLQHQCLKNQIYS